MCHFDPKYMSLYFYSTNPYFSHIVSEKYLNKKHVVWCSDLYDTGGAPSSSPCELFISLQKDCESEDSHSRLIAHYKKTFRNLAVFWKANNFITSEQKDEIVFQIDSHGWKIWRPQLYIICRSLIESSNRLIRVAAQDRASTAEEWKIQDLDSSEFEIIQRIR
jgi:hypothetical protein